MTRGKDADVDLERVLRRFPILSSYYKTQADRLSGGQQAAAHTSARCPR